MALGYLFFLQNYLLKIIYVKGKTHYVAELLSRTTVSEVNQVQ